MELVEPPSSMEGKVVDGQSRHPLQHRGLQVHNGHRCTVWSAKFDVKAHVAESIDPPPKFFPDAELAVGTEIICEQVTIITDTKKVKGTLSKGSASHKTNHWHFSDQTGVRIDRGHEEIQNALRARRANVTEDEALAAPPPKIATPSKRKKRR